MWLSERGQGMSLGPGGQPLAVCQYSDICPCVSGWLQITSPDPSGYFSCGGIDFHPEAPRTAARWGWVCPKQTVPYHNKAPSACSVDAGTRSVRQRHRHHLHPLGEEVRQERSLQILRQQPLQAQVGLVVGTRDGGNAAFYAMGVTLIRCSYDQL